MWSIRYVGTSLITTPPTSSRWNADHALPRSFVKTPAWSPKVESLTASTAASKLENGDTATTGANASSRTTRESIGASTRIVGGKKLPEAGPPKSILAPPVIGSSNHEQRLAPLDS